MLFRYILLRFMLVVVSTFFVWMVYKTIELIIEQRKERKELEEEERAEREEEEKERKNKQ